MLRFSASVARRTNTSPASLHPTNSGGSPPPTSERIFFPLYQDPIDSDSSSVGNDGVATDLDTQDQECLTLPPSARTGFSQTCFNKRTQNISACRISDMRTPRDAPSQRRNVTNQTDGKEENSDDAEAEEARISAIAHDTTHGTTPGAVHPKKIYTTKYTIREKRLIVQEAFSLPKKSGRLLASTKSPMAPCTTGNISSNTDWRMRSAI